jgi:hypothetical protein
VAIVVARAVDGGVAGSLRERMPRVG